MNPAHVSVADMVAEGRKVAARLRWRGTHRDTGMPYRLSGIILVHLDAAGRFKERWSAYAPQP